MFMSFHLLKTCIKILLYSYFFCLVTLMPTRIGERIFSCGEVSFVKLVCQTVGDHFFPVLTILNRWQVSLSNCQRCFYFCTLSPGLYTSVPSGVGARIFAHRGRMSDCCRYQVDLLNRLLLNFYCFIKFR
jgi:hypothetical protein